MVHCENFTLAHQHRTAILLLPVSCRDLVVEGEMEIEEEVSVEETEDADKEEEVEKTCIKATTEDVDKEEEEEVEETGIKAISAVKDQGTNSVASLMH